MNKLFILLVAFFASWFSGCIDYYKPDYQLSSNIEVSLNGYDGATKEEVQAEVDRVVLAVSKEIKNIPDLLNQQKVYVHFEPGLGDCKELRAPCDYKLAGWANEINVTVYYSTRNAQGKYETNPKAPLSSLAFGHELAHVILLRDRKVPATEQDDYLRKHFGF